jgi:hypothetical protein
MGDSASLSFLDFLRHTFHYYMGPSPFTDKQMAKAMLEAVIPLRVSDDILEGSPESQLNIEEMKDYVDRFFIAVRNVPLTLSHYSTDRSYRQQDWSISTHHKNYLTY